VGVIKSGLKYPSAGGKIGPEDRVRQNFYTPVLKGRKVEK